MKKIMVVLLLCSWLNIFVYSQEKKEEQRSEQAINHDTNQESVQKTALLSGQILEQKIQQLVSAKTPGQRATAAMALGNYRDKKAVIALIEALNTEKIVVQKHAVKSLGKICNRHEINLLIQNCKNDNKLSDAEKNEKIHGYKEITEICEKSVIPALVAKAKDTDADLRKNVVVALGKTGSISVEKTLLESLDDISEAIREEAVSGLGNIGSQKSIQKIAKMLSFDPKRSVRRTCAEVLGKIGDNSTIPLLKKALEETKKEPKDTFIHLTICASLKQLGDDTGIPILINALEDESDSVKTTAIGLLGMLKEKRAIDALTKLSKNDKSSTVKDSATRALKEIKGEK
ncbi:MAG: HEAT repeat domain-containing protein [Elusimicrobiota bacterium]